MSRVSALWIVLLLSSGSAWAQDGGFGLDLTEDSTTAPAEDDSSADETSSEEEDTDAAAAAVTLEEPAPEKPSEPLLGEREITQDDRVKSVQRKVYLKRHRFELAPYISVSVNDPFYSKFGGFLRGAYYLADTLAIAGRASIYQTLPSTDVRRAKAIYGQMYNSVPQWSAIGDIEWSPFYGKVAMFNSIYHFDAYVIGGLGAMYTVTSGRLGLHPAADLGAGLRFVARDYLAVNVSIINTAYVDQPTGTTKGALQNMTTLNAGISIFFPFKSTGREAE